MSVSEVQGTPNPKDLLSAAFDDPDYQRFVKIAEGQIWSGCFGFSVVSNLYQCLYRQSMCRTSLCGYQA
jgi:hypothetical protein